MRNVPLLLLALPAAAVTAQPPRDSLAPAARAARIEADLRPPALIRGRPIERVALADRMKALNVPAVSIAVVEEGRLAWARAYGLADVASGRRATTATRFQAASMSKPVAGTAALQLVASGRLALDADVNRELKSWQVPMSPSAGGRPVTLRHLLTHTAGLTIHGFPGYATGAVTPTVVQILDGVPPANTRAVRLDTAPGVIWRYSGGGTTVMQVLLADVTGKRFPELMEESVLARAGMLNSTFEQPLPEGYATEAATGYRRDGAPIAGRYHTYPEMAAAGLWTTPGDLARWIVAIQRSLEGASGALLPRPIAQAMVTPGIGGWGLGVGVEGTGDARRFVHGGANEGFRGSFAGWVSGGRGVVVMTNGDAGGGLAVELIAAVAREYGWPGYGQREIIPAVVPVAALDSLAGRYVDPRGAVFVASRDGGDLAVQSPTRRHRLVPTGHDAFAFAESGQPVRIERDASGRAVALRIGDDRYPRQP
jgi:CubicO group peptidase (beta-lactamase class C family)